MTIPLSGLASRWIPLTAYAAAAALVAGLAYFVFVHMPRERAFAIDQWRQRLEPTADDRAEAVVTWVSDWVGDSTLISSFPAVAALLGAKPTPVRPPAEADAAVHVETLLSGLVQAQHARAALIFDRRLAAVAVAPRGHPLQAETRALATRVLANGRFGVQLFVETGGAPVVAACAPVPAGRLRLGVACLENAAMPSLFALLGRRSGTETGETLIVRREGDALLFLSPLRYASARPGETQVANPVRSLAAVAAADGRSVSGEFLDYRGVHVVAAVRPVRETDWGLVVKVDRDEALAPYYREIRDVFLYATLVSIVLASLVWAASAARRASLLAETARTTARYAALVEAASDGILLAAADGRILDANRRAEELYGWTRDELRTRTVFDLRAERTREAAARDMAWIAAEGRGVFETVHQRKDASTFPVEVSSRFLASERVHLSIVREITERTRLDAERREAIDRLQAIIDAAPAAVLSMTLDGRASSWNAGAERIFGWTAEEALGRPLPFVGPEDIEEFSRLRERVGRGERLNGVTLRRHRKDGSPIDIGLWTAPLVDAQGQMVSTMGVILDLRERLATEARGLHLNRLLRTLLEVSEVIARASDRRTLFGDVCRILTERGEFALAWIGVIERATGRVIPVAKAGRASAYVDEIEVRCDDTPQGRGPIGTVIREGRHVFTADAQTDSRMGPWSETLARHELRASAAFPIRTDAGVIGALTVYATQPGMLMADEVALLDTLAGDLSFALQSLDDRADRTQAEMALRENEERLRLALMAASQGLYDVNVQTGEEIVTPEYARMLGYEPEEFHETNAAWHERLHPDDCDAVYRVYEDYIAGRRPDYRVEYRQLTKQGVWKWILSIGRIVERDAEGRPLRMLGTHTDITDRRMGEEALRETADRLALQFATMPFACVVADSNLSILDWNPAAERIFGFRRVEVLGRSGFETIIPVDERERLADLPQRLAAATGPLHLTSWNLRQDGGRILCEWWDAPLRSPDGRLAGIMAMAIDITEEERTRQELTRLTAELEQRVADRTAALEFANRELEAFTYSVSHDLRAPLRAIDGFSRLALEDYGPTLDAEGQRLLTVVRKSAQKMDRLIDDLLDLSRVGRRELRRARVDMTALARSAFAELTPDEADRANVEFRLDTLPAASGDASLLRQLWLNLLGNALKFGANKPTRLIEVGAQRKDAQVVYHVRDNGAGFDPRYADRLFGVFQRLHTDAEFPGTGVGLAIVQRVAVRHGGRAWAEGRPGEGATFFFTLSEGSVSDVRS